MKVTSQVELEARPKAGKAHKGAEEVLSRKATVNDSYVTDVTEVPRCVTITLSSQKSLGKFIENVNM